MCRPPRAAWGAMVSFQLVLRHLSCSASITCICGNLALPGLYSYMPSAKRHGHAFESYMPAHRQLAARQLPGSCGWQHLAGCRYGHGSSGPAHSPWLQAACIDLAYATQPTIDTIESRTMSCKHLQELQLLQTSHVVHVSTKFVTPIAPTTCTSGNTGIGISLSTPEHKPQCRRPHRCKHQAK